MPWVQINLTKRSYYDPRTGEVLQSIEGRKNRPNIDPIAGGGHSGYPKIERSKIKSFHQKGTALLIEVEATAEEVTAMKGTVVSESQAERMKKDVFKVQSMKAESGVTK